MFMEDYCMNCIHCDPDPEGEKQCDILCRTMVFSVNDPEYPGEWTYDDDGKPTCTEWVKWDWGNDGDPDDPNNGRPIGPSNDPNQLGLFPLYPDERTYSEKDRNGVLRDFQL